jgi:transposase
LEHLPVIEVVIEPENLDLEKYKRIGEERTRTLEFEPGKLYVKEIIRPKYGLAEMLLQKYEYHVPFYRQVRSFRHPGLRIPKSTLSSWFKPACELLQPLYKELKKQVLVSDYLQVNETTLPVIDGESRQAKKEYLRVVRSIIDGRYSFTVMMQENY